MVPWEPSTTDGKMVKINQVHWLLHFDIENAENITLDDFELNESAVLLGMHPKTLNVSQKRCHISEIRLEGIIGNQLKKRDSGHGAANCDN